MIKDNTAEGQPGHKIALIVNASVDMLLILLARVTYISYWTAAHKILIRHMKFGVACV